jgi:hypothetical protein
LRVRVDGEMFVVSGKHPPAKQKLDFWGEFRILIVLLTLYACVEVDMFFISISIDTSDVVSNKVWITPTVPPLGIT